MEKHDELFTPGQVDQQIERFSRAASDDRDAATGDETNARLLLDLRRAYRQQASARQDGLGRVLDRLLQHEAQSARRALPSTPLQSAQERKSGMEHSVSGPTPRHTLAQRLGLLAAAALLVLLVGSMAVVINLAHQQKESTGKRAATKTASTTTAQSNLYVAFDRTIEKLDSKTGKVLWTFSAPGGVYTPVTVAQGVVYIVPQDSAIIALNATSGKQLWHTNQHFNGSVVVVQNIIYAINSDSDALTALNASNGHILWQRQPASISGIAVADGIIYGTATIESPSVSAYAVLSAFNASDGTELWHKTFSGQSLVNTPQIVDGVLYASSTLDNKAANPPDRHSYVYAFDAKTGTMLWRSIEIKAYMGDAPTVANDMVYVGSNALGTDGPAVYAFRASDGSLAWKKPVSNSVDSCLLADKGVLYVAEATSSSIVATPLLALDASNGSVRWSHSLTGYVDDGYGNCTINDGLLYVITDLDGTLHVLRITDGVQVSSYNLAGNTHAFMLPFTLALAP
jgi:outer membrane protein assembly factor BamB